MNIGELARSADVNIDTIRFYERRGVVGECSPTGSPAIWLPRLHECYGRASPLSSGSAKLGFHLGRDH